MTGSEDAANTTKLEVQFPADKPLASVSIQPVPGWTATANKTKLATPIKTDDGEVTEAVTSITWTGGTIKPGEFQQFPVSAGPLPDDVDALTLKAVQTYDNGDVVRWVEEAIPGAAEPEHPAPQLKLTAAEDAATTTTTARAAASPTTAAPAATAGVAKSSDVDSAKTLGIVGIVVGALGLLTAAGALARKPKPTPTK